VPFDLEALSVTGEPVVVIEDVMMEPGGAAHLTVSDKGMLIYVPGGTLVPNRKLVWVNRQGEFEPLPVPAREYKEPSVSPDGQRVAVTIREGSNYDIWISEVARGTLTRLTSHPGEDGDPIWTPDGKRVTFSSEMTGNSPTLWWRPADGSGPAEELLKRDVRKVRWPRSWVTDSQILAFTEWDRENGDISIWLLDVEDKGEPRPFLRTEFDEFLPMLSPDSRWISYISDESGQDEVYVQAFPGGGGRWQISVGGGRNPVWAPNGQEIFYRNGDKMMAVAIDTESEFSAGAPQVLFEGRFLGTGWVSEGRNYDISPDGQRFLMIKREQDVMPTELIVVLNWFEELKRLVPTP
jgi:Tol biopolymer transport system component